MEAGSDMQPVSWKIVKITPIERWWRLRWLFLAQEIPANAERYVTPWDRSFFWLVQRTMMEHISLRLGWTQVDCDAIEFVLRILIAISVFRRRN